MTRNLACLSVSIAGVLYAQSPAAPRFEVASVKPSNPETNSGQSGGKSGDGRLTMSNVTLKRCIMGAYGIGPNQIAGGPAWVDSDRYDIVAKADQRAGDSELMPMLQSLLADRFKLALHRETRSIQAYVLAVAKNGPKLVKAAGDDARTRNGRGLIDAKAITMDRLAEVLSRQMELPVINSTGLAGAFDLKLEWTPISDTAPKPGADAIPPPAGPSIATALQEQLGLRLQTRNAPIVVLVIDHVERPSEN